MGLTDPFSPERAKGLTALPSVIAHSQEIELQQDGPA